MKKTIIAVGMLLLSFSMGAGADGGIPPYTTTVYDHNETASARLYYPSSVDGWDRNHVYKISANRAGLETLLRHTMPALRYNRDIVLVQEQTKSCSVYLGRYKVAYVSGQCDLYLQ